jgi:hypothetical protein
VLGGGFDGPGHAQDAGSVGTVAGDDVEQDHLPGGHGAGLVQHHRVDLARRLEDFRALDQDAQLGAAAGADQQGGRRGQAERAGAGDDQDRDGGGEGRGPAAAGADPPAERRDGQGDDDRHEHTGDAVGEALHGGLAGLGLLDQRRHLRQLGVRADPGGAHDQPATGVDGRADHGVADADLDRHGFAGEHARVDRRDAVLDHCVGGDLLARPDHEPIPHRKQADRDAGLDAVAQHGDILGTQFQQRPHGGAGAALGTGLEVAAGEDERGDPGGGLQVDVAAAVAAADVEGERVRHAGQAGGAEEQRPQRPAEGGEGAQRDERVHGGGAVAKVRPGGLVERQPAVDDDRRGQGQRQPLPVGELQRRDHRHGDHRHAQHDRGPQPGTQPAQFVGRWPGLVRVISGVRRCGQFRGVAGLLDRGDQITGGEGVRVRDGGFLGGVVDRGRDAVHAVELLLDPRRAGGARHAADRQLDPVRRRQQRLCS